MMMMAEEPDRRRQHLHPMSTTVAVLSPEEPKDAHTPSSSTDMEERTMREEESDECPETTSTTTGGRSYTKNRDAGGDTEESDEVGNNYSINPNSLSTPSPSSPAGSLKSSSSGGGGANSATRRIFTPEFKQRVLEAFTNDPDCIGNQRATARKFSIHRRQVQKWLQQPGGPLSDQKDQQSSDDQEQKAKNDKESNSTSTGTQNPFSVSSERRTHLEGKGKSTRNSTSNRAKSKMPIVAGKGPSIPQASAVSSSPSASLPSSSPLINLGKSIGNMHHPLFSNNASSLFLGLTNPLLSLPLAMEASSSRHSPPRHSPQSHSMNGSPPNGNLSSNAQRMLELVDELCYLYPSEDFSLLRRAMLKNEVSFTKLSPPVRRNYSSSSHKSSSPSPSTNDYITQQTLQMIKSQNEYLQLLQSGYVNLSNFPDVGSLSDPSNKYSAWLNPFAAAAASGFNVSGGKNGNSYENSRRKANDSILNQHNFASPKAPVSNSKSKTVAAVLAASRNSPNNSRGNSSYDKPKRPSQRKKMSNGRPMKSSTVTYSPKNDDDFIDPTSMLEVVTTKPSSFGNHYNPADSQGMDLSTTSNSVIQRSPPSLITTTSTLRSKAMNKDYGFLSELGLVRKEGPNGHTNPLISSTASLEHFVDNVLPQRRLSPSTNSVGSPQNDANESLDRKNLVLEAFNFDPELAGDARGVARKFGLNIRVVQKWIRETPTRSLPSSIQSNGGSSWDSHHMQDPEMEDVNDNLPNTSFQKSVIANTNGPVNKRKNPKPNQICDFTEDFEDNNPLDMVVPIKKRRVSTPTPTSA